jgi:hypothetical protein
MIHFLLDSSLGLLLIFFGIRFSQHIARVKNLESFNFGEYGRLQLIALIKRFILLKLFLEIYTIVKNYNNPSKHNSIHFFFRKTRIC